MSIRKKILFVSYGGGHINLMLPVIRRCIENPNYDVTVLGLTTAGLVLEKAGIPYIGFKDLATEKDSAALEYGKTLAKDLGSAVSVEESSAYLGLSYQDLVDQLGVNLARERFEALGRQTFLPVGIMRRLFSRLAPDLLVASNSPRAERAAFIVARENAISSVCIVDLFALKEVEWIAEPGYGSRICVLSEGVRKMFLDAGRHSDEVVVTGNPAFDRLSDPSFVTEAQRFRREKQWVNKKVILWASQVEPQLHPFTGEVGNPDLPRNVEAELLGIISRREDWVLYIRRHPNEVARKESATFNVYYGEAGENLAVVLNVSDVVVTLTSTVGIEAVLSGRPLVTVEGSVFTNDAPYSKMGLSQGVQELSLLEGSILAAAEGKQNIPYAVPRAGNATESVVQVIGKLVQENSH